MVGPQDSPGQSFSKVLEEALNSAKCVVVLWSKTSVASDWVQNEAAEGKRRGILVPAFIEDTAPPSSSEESKPLTWWIGTKIPQAMN